MATGETQLFCIGGETTVGKTTLATALRSQLPLDTVSSDAQRSTLWHNWNRLVDTGIVAESRRPFALFRMFEERARYRDDVDWARIARQVPMHFVRSRIAQSNYVFEHGIRPALRTNMDRQISTLAEGLALRPRNIAGLRKEYPLRAVVLGNQDRHENIKRLEKAIEENPGKHWARGWNVEKRQAFAEQIRVGSYNLELSCKQHAVEYIEMSGAETPVAYALERLLTQDVQYTP
ncbi:MAG TPA: hypothetical protein VJR27_03495 [Candidatus Saccharimonadales bacterium]|nr:hypothetical protein [Candidatus Saccharimonadales bacterium]